MLCGEAGLLRGVRATTHWSAFHLLEYFGAVPEAARVVADGKLMSTAGVTAGLDGALRVAALLCGERMAQQIQLSIEYAPEPPFHSGTPGTASPEVLAAEELPSRPSAKRRLRTAKRVAVRLTHTERIRSEEAVMFLQGLRRVIERLIGHRLLW